MIEVGKLAPTFSLLDDSGTSVSLSSFAGKSVVVYFYPKDNTPGCTTEACDFRDRFDKILSTGAVLLGISPDSGASHAKFRAKFGLPFPLLVDPDKSVHQAYGVWGEKNMYGKKVMGVIRSTFLIDANGVVRKVWQPVRVAGHADEVVAALQEIAH